MSNMEVDQNLNSPKILIVGAGPTGLTLAAELTRHHISCRIIDKSIKPVKTSNALGIQARTLEIFADMGIIDDFLQEGMQVKQLNIRNHHSLPITEIKLDQINSKYKFLLIIPQHKTEAILLKHLADRGIHVEMQTELMDLRQSENKTTAVIKDQYGNLEETEFDWIMACDGGRSIVREKCGMPFNGRDLPEHFVMIDANIETPLPANEIHLFLGKKGVVGILPYSKQYSRLIAEVTHDPLLKNTKTPVINDFERLTTERCFQPITFNDPIWTSGFWIHERLINHYQYQNIFFLGDAAHTHSPVGGQGMNIGIQDAYNLAWKFALVRNHNVNSIILTTYETERRPIARSVLKASTLGTHLISLQNYFLIKLRNFIIKQIASSKALTRKLQAAISETAIRYHHSAIVFEGLPYKRGLKAGQKFIDVECQGRWLFDYVQGSQHTILIFLPDPLSEETITIIQKLQQFLLNERFSNIFNIVVIHSSPLPDTLITGVHQIFDKEQKIHNSYNINFPALYVVRPDKYIGFRSGLSNNELIKFINHLFT
jgi:2-polyprenyl-6-methoxyphenol hydroxylase-like FAD-dependent oxidoreductase